MTRYQGRALGRPEPRRGGNGLGSRILRVLLAMAVLGALAMVPWRSLRQAYAVVTAVEVRGVRYLDATRIREAAGVREGDDLFAVDHAVVRQRVMMVPRIESARVGPAGLRGVRIDVVERVPALAVVHGETWEVDTAGVLLEPLQRGVVADVPLLTGVDLSRFRPGAQVRTPGVQRGLAWTARLRHHALRLEGQVSEVDVSQARVTRLVLMGGTRVIGPAWPVSLRQMSGLRATLADLEAKGMRPSEVDLRFDGQVIIRDSAPATVAGSVP